MSPEQFLGLLQIWPRFWGFSSHIPPGNSTSDSVSFSNSRSSFRTFYLFFEEKCLQCWLGPIFAKSAYEGNHSYSRLWQSSRCLEYKTGTPPKWKVNEPCIPTRNQRLEGLYSSMYLRKDALAVKCPCTCPWWTPLLPALSRATGSLRLWVPLPYHQTGILTLKELLVKESVLYTISSNQKGWEEKKEKEGRRVFLSHFSLCWKLVCSPQCRPSLAYSAWGSACQQQSVNKKTDSKLHMLFAAQ